MSNESKIIESIPIDKYYNENIVQLQNHFRPMYGSKPTGVCPFHTDTDPSLSYWKEKNLFHCFGCKETGDIIKMHQLIQKLYYKKNITREQSMVELATKYGVALERTETGELKKENPFADKEPQTLPEFTILDFEKKNEQIMSNEFTSFEAKAQSFLNIDIQYYLSNVYEGD